MLRKHSQIFNSSKSRSITLDLLKSFLKAKLMPSTSSEAVLIKKFLREDFSSRWEDNRRSMLKTGLPWAMFLNNSNKHLRRILNLKENLKSKRELIKGKRYNNQKKIPSHKLRFNINQSNTNQNIKFNIRFSIKLNIKHKQSQFISNNLEFKRKLNLKYSTSKSQKSNIKFNISQYNISKSNIPNLPSTK